MLFNIRERTNKGASIALSIDCLHKLRQDLQRGISNVCQHPLKLFALKIEAQHQLQHGSYMKKGFFA
jgi:hypothetical protein